MDTISTMTLHNFQIYDHSVDLRCRSRLNEYSSQIERHIGASKSVSSQNCQFVDVEKLEFKQDPSTRRFAEKSDDL